MPMPAIGDESGGVLEIFDSDFDVEVIGTCWVDNYKKLNSSCRFLIFLLMNKIFNLDY